jgi:hypothetical protein
VHGQENKNLNNYWLSKKTLVKRFGILLPILKKKLIMKKYFYFILLSFVVFSCKKESSYSVSPRPWIPSSSYMSNVNAYLKTNLADTDYANIDFSNSIISKQPVGWFLRIAFLHKLIARDFVLLQTDSSGNVSAGKFVHILRDTTVQKVFTGTVKTETIYHTQKSKSVITNGVAVNELAPVDEDPVDDDDVVPSCADCLPEVVVIGYAPSGGGGGGISYADYLSLTSLIGTGSNPVPVNAGGTYSGIYSPLNGTVSGSGSPSGGNAPSPKPSNDITINYETDASKPGIDVNVYMKAFSTIPDAGSTCSVTIYTDLPVDDNPSYIFNILTGATGHCFIQLTKTNDTQTVTQIIGKTTSKALAVLAFPVAGKIIDNSSHKYNASLTMKITPAQLTTEINAVIAIGNTPSYNMWDNNCVDYALGILNAIRPGNPLNVGMSIDPSTDEAYQTPQSLYIALQNLKGANGPDAANITMDVVRNAGVSTGLGQ